MGYYYHFLNCELHVKAESIPVAADLLRQMLANGENYYSKDIDFNAPDSKFIESVALCYGWYAVVNQDGDLVNPRMRNDEKKNNDGATWMEVIAPCVEDGGFVEIEDDDGHIYRKVFINGRVYGVKPTWPTKDEILAQAAEEE